MNSPSPPVRRAAHLAGLRAPHEKVSAKVVQALTPAAAGWVGTCAGTASLFRTPRMPHAAREPLPDMTGRRPAGHVSAEGAAGAHRRIGQDARKTRVPAACAVMGPGGATRPVSGCRRRGAMGHGCAGSPPVAVILELTQAESIRAARISPPEFWRKFRIRHLPGGRDVQDRRTALPRCDRAARGGSGARNGKLQNSSNWWEHMTNGMALETGRLVRVPQATPLRGHGERGHRA
jgi:hypothetical protein